MFLITVNPIIILSTVVAQFAIVIQASPTKDEAINAELHGWAVDKKGLQELDQAGESTAVDTKFLIPNIAHYIWYTKKKKELKFTAYLSILSASRMMKADKIYFHTDNKPTGVWWEETKKIPNLIIKNRTPPKKMFGVLLKKPVFETSHSNADRLKIMQEYGGVIADLDILYVNSLDPLRRYPAVVGFELGKIVCGGFIMSAPNSTFIYLWLNKMLNDYYVEKWGFISGVLSSRLVERYNMSGLVHPISRKIHHPGYNEFRYLIGPDPYDWRQNYAVHLFVRLWKDTKYEDSVAVLNPETIKTMNTTFGEIARKIYYGKSDLIY